jgi:hypothetical protein
MPTQPLDPYAGFNGLYAAQGYINFDSSNGLTTGFTGASLNNFRETASPADNGYAEIGYQWDNTPFQVQWPTVLHDGDTATFTYQTVMTTFSGYACTDACVLAYGAFGDPIGRGGSLAGINPFIFSDALGGGGGGGGDGGDGINFDTFHFDLPNLDQNGNLSFELASVPEPGTWALLLMGMGLVGASLRRRRRAQAA